MKEGVNMGSDPPVSPYSLICIEIHLHHSSYKHIVTQWSHIVTKIWVDTGSGNDLLLDSTKLLMLTYQQPGPMTFIWRQFH